MFLQVFCRDFNCLAMCICKALPPFKFFLYNHAKRFCASVLHKNIRIMKCLVSKNSVLKSVVLTLVSVLCFAGVSVGQTYEIIDRDGDGSIVSSFVQNFNGCSYYKVKNNNQYNDKAFRVKKDGSYMTADAGHDANWKWKSEDWGGRVYVISGGNSVYVKLCGDNVSISLNRPSELPESTSPWLVEPFKHNGDQTNCLSGVFESCKQDEYICFVETTNNSGIYFQITRDGDVYDKSYFTNSEITQEDWGAKFWKYEGGGFLTNEFGKKGIWVIIKPKQGSLTFSNSEKPNCGNKVASATASESSTGLSSACLSDNPQLTSTYTVGSGSFTPKYQWFKGGSEISGATSSTYTPNAVGSYTVKVYAGDYSDANPAVSNTVSITGPIVSTVTLSSDNDVFCSGNTTLSVVDDASCSPSGYPQYKWYKGNDEVSGATSPTYSPTEAGTYKVIVYADANTYKESDAKTLNAPTPSITVSPSELSLNGLVDGNATLGSVTVSLENSCSTLKTPVITGPNASMYSVTNNNNGTYTISFTPGSTTGSYPATITFSSNDNAVSESVSLKGKVLSCISSDIATFDFDNNSLGTTNGITLSTSLTNQTSQQWNPGYMIGSGNKTFYGGQGEMSYNSGNCFQFYYKNEMNDKSVLSLSGASLDATAYYSIEFLIGEAGTNGKSGEVYGEIYIDGTKLGEVQYRSSTTIRKVFSGAELQSGKSIVVKGVNHTSDGNVPANCYVYYIDNLKVTKACPPEVDYSTISNECDVNPSFTAEVTKGSADVVKYEWYVLEEGQSPVLVATHNSSSLSDVFSQSAEIGTGKKVRVVVTDANGLSADVEYEINCGPVIDDIIAPAEICPDGNLTLTIPSYTSSSTVTDAGWEIAESATATRSEWTELSSLNSVPETYKNWYIRYFVENAEGRGKSNAVQITMFDAPVVDPIFVDDICSGDAFVLTAPSVEYDAAQDIEEWQYSTQSDFSETTVFTTGNTFTAGTYYIRYAATDACTTTYATTTAVVHDPSLSVTEYPTFMRVAGTQQVVADAPVLDATCVGELSYSITDGNTNGYFSINETTGVITMTSAATETGEFPITVTITDGTTTITKDLIITITEEPTLMLQCSGETDYYAYTKYQKLNIQNVVTSNFVNDDVTLTLSGSAASYFTLTPSSVTKNTPNVPVTIAQNDFFTGVGDYTLKLTATTEGLTKECNVNIHVKNLNITDYINDQTNCSSDAPSLMVEVTGEDATNLPLTYQWYNNGVAVSGATSKTFKPTVDGDYYCEVSTGGTLLHKSKSANVFFVKNMPVLSFDETAAPIPSEVFCTQEVGAVMKVTLNGADVTSDYKRFWWLIGSESDGLTSDNIHTFSFDCASNDYTATIGAYIMENATKCVIRMAKAVTIKKMANTYYYCGPTGENSNVTDPNNWWTNPNGTGNHPAVGTAHVDSNGDGTPDTDVENAFYEDASKFIIDKDGVILKSDEIWNVTGVGSTITISSGFYDKAALPSAGEGWSTSNNQYDYKSGQYFQFASSSMNGKNQVERMSSVASSDYRNYAKVVTIAGTLNTYGNAKVDVDHGGSLTIASDKGDFEFGTLQNDEITHYNGDSNGYYNVCVNPGSSVTYTGDGTKKIRNGIYSQLYIEPTNSTDDIIFEESAKVDIIQSFTLGTNANFEKINANGSSVYYVGTVHQDIASMPYYVLDVENSNNKTLTGRIDVEKSMTIGAGSKLVAGSNTINLNGKGSEALVFEGLFDCGTSTVNYNSTDETTIAAMDYYNLNLGNGNRTFATDNNVGIAGTFTPSSNSRITYTIDNSTIEFNGTEAQAIPAFTFYNMIINNTAMSGNNNESFFDNIHFVQMIGDVTIQNKLQMVNGILDVKDYQLLINNTSADAIGQGYFNSFIDASFVIGAVTRAVPSSLTGNDMGKLYYFPIGDEYGYKPLTLSQLTTSNDAIVTAGISTAVSGNFVDGESSDPFSSTFSWHVDGENYMSASVGISTSQGLGDANAIAYNTQNSGDFTNVYGSSSENSILYSQIKGPGYYALAKRTVTNKKYYFNCNGTANASSLSAWHTEEGGTGDEATDFNEPDAEWIFNCGTTINEPLVIHGANSKVTMNIPFEDELKINSVVSFITGSIKQGVVNVTNNGEFDVMYSFTMNDVSNGSGGVNKNNRSWIKNSGTVNIYNSTMVLTDSWITNNKGALFNLVNTDMKITSGSNQGVDALKNNLKDGENWWKQQPHSCFWNYGNVVMTNGSLDVTDDGGAWVAHVTNANGANWLIDNTNASGVKHVTFDGCELSHDGEGIAYVDMQCGSTFAVKNSDVQILYKGQGISADIGGEVIVEDGNLYIARSDGTTGGTFNLEQKCGTMYLIDTDGNGDGLLELKGAGGGYEVNIEGTVYAQGVVESGGNGASLNIKKDGTMFIGDLGATIPAYTWNFHIDVEEGGTLYYCGNRTSGADGVGSNEGDLYYAGSYYETRNPMEQQNSNPAGEGDFSGGGNYEPIFVGEKECMEAYVEGLPDTRKGTLLPIELTLLYGVCNENGDVVIHWQTASETNNDYFTILRSFDGVHFEELDIVWGAGTTTEFHNYEYFDTDDNTGIVYYKLRQTDYDGNTTESKVIAVQTCGPNAQFRIAEDQIDIFFKHPEESSFVVITSITGQIFYSKSFRNTEAARIAAPQRKGIYIISVIDSKTITSEKFIR